MADSWTEIDSDGYVLDWTSVDTLTLGDLWHPFNAVRRALNERQAATGATQTAAIDRLQDIYGAMNTLHNAITAQISLFADHTDNSGNWHGQQSIPSWSESTLLAAIGDASRIVPIRLEILAPWLIQSYKILNLLKWVKNKYTSTVVYWKDAQSNISWADCETNFLSSTWVDIGTKYNFIFLYSGLYQTINFWRKQAWHLKKTISWTHAFHFDVDLYSYNYSGYDSPQIVFQSIENINQEGALNKNAQYSDASISPMDLDVIVDLNNFDSSFPDPKDIMPASDNGYTNEMVIFPDLTTLLCGIMKYDITGGFKFKNW